MLTRVLLIALVALLTNSCGGGDKYLPSSNPPEYDPKKVYTMPAAPPSAPATVTTPTEMDLLRSKLDSLEMGEKAKGEGKKVPFDPNLLQLFKGVTRPCEALSRLAQGLGSTQLFRGNEGASLKKALGPDADGIVRRMDEQLAEGLKHSLGPAAADCPISVRPRKSSSLKDLSRSARLVLTHASSTQPLLLAQTTIPDTSQDDYEVQKSSSRENPSPDWVGYKTTEIMTRIGKEERPTKGIREHYEMIIAPKAKRCPDPEGWVVGTFEWSIVLYRATTGPDGATRGVLYRRHVTADLKGKVDDDAKVEYVKFDATVALQHIGTDLPYYSQPAGIQGRFTIDQRMMGVPQELKIITVSGFSEGEAQIKDAQLLGTLTALMAYFSGQEYFNAQTEWKDKPNTCVEIIFTPATKTKKLGPNESVSVKTELRTKKEQAIVPAKFKEAKERPRERNGTVSPREAQSQPGTPARFTYQAPPTRVRHSGFWVKTISRAGVAQALDGEWEVAEGAYILEFQSRIVDSEPTAPAESVAAGKVTLTLVEGKDMYRGSGMVGYQTGPPPNRDPCTSLIMGHGTMRLDVAGMFIKLSERTGPADSQVASADIELHYLIHPTNETERPVTYVDYQCVPGKPLPHPFFYGMYAVSRGAEEINLLKGWTYVGKNGVVATKSLHGNCGDLCEDVSVFTLKEAEGSEGAPTP